MSFILNEIHPYNVANQEFINAAKNKISINREMPFIPRILKDRVQAIYNNEVFFEMESYNPDLDLLLNQSSRIMAYQLIKNYQNLLIRVNLSYLFLNHYILTCGYDSLVNQ